MGENFLGVLPPVWGSPPAEQEGEDETKAGKPQQYFEAEGLREPGLFQVQDMLKILKGLLNLKPVVIDPNNLLTTECSVGGQNVPGFTRLRVITAYHTQCHVPESNGGVR